MKLHVFVLSTFQLMIFESLNEIKADSYETSLEAVELLQSRKISDYILRKCQERQIKATWEAKKTTVQVFASTPQDLTSAVAIMKSSLLDTSRDVSEERIRVVMSEEFKRHVRRIEHCYLGEMKLVFSADLRC